MQSSSHLRIHKITQVLIVRANLITWRKLFHCSSLIDTYGSAHGTLVLGVWQNRGNAFISEDRGNKDQIFEGNMGQRQYWGTGNTRKQGRMSIYIMRTLGNRNFFTCGPSIYTMDDPDFFVCTLKEYSIDQKRVNLLNACNFLQKKTSKIFHHLLFLTSENKSISY